MPIYEYQCPNCQKVFEEWTHVTDMQAQEPCPDCGTPSPRVMSHTSFVLKGGGWYVSDYGYRKGIKDENSTSTFFFRLLVDEFHFFRQHCQQHFRRLGFFHLLFVDPFRVRYL